MIIRGMLDEDRTQAASLWRGIFEDSEPFTAWYFRERYDPRHSFAAFDNDRLIAMTLGRSAPFRAEGRTHNALLISGVSTLPEYRGQGLMRALLQRQTDHAKGAGFACCYLHPVSESLYAPLGFVNGTDALLIGSDANRAHKPFTLREGADVEAMRAVYDALSETHDGMQLRGEAEFSAVLADYAADGASTLIAYAENRPVGYICCSDEETAFELSALCAPAYAFLLDEAAKRAGKACKAVVPTDCGLSGERVCGMQYLVFNGAFALPLKNGFCSTSY